MTITLFMALLTLLAIITSTATTGVKNFLDGINVKYSSNVVVAVVSAIIGGGGTAITYVFLGVDFTAANIISIALMAVAVWFSAMVGYDKVIQMIKQIKATKWR